MEKVVIFDWGGVIMHKHPVDNNDKEAIIRTIKSFNPSLTDDEAWKVYTSTLADDERQCLTHGEAQKAYNKKLISNFDAEIGEVILGNKDGRTSDKDITIFDSTGLFLQDLATSIELLNEANKDNIGVEIEL